MKSFSIWLCEREVEENKMNAGIVKKINVDLFQFVKTTTPFDDLKEVIPQIESILDKYEIVIVGDDGKEFADKIIISLGEKDFSLATKDAEIDNIYSPYTNVKLNLEWAQKDRQYIIKDVSILSK